MQPAPVEFRSILGNLLGALNGEDVFPQRWAGADLEDTDELRRLADDLYDLR